MQQGEIQRTRTSHLSVEYEATKGSVSPKIAFRSGDIRSQISSKFHPMVHGCPMKRETNQEAKQGCGVSFGVCEGLRRVRVLSHVICISSGARENERID